MPRTSVHVRPRLHGPEPPQRTAAIPNVAAAAADGTLPVGERAGLPLHRFPLELTADAHVAVKENTVGKVLIDV